MVVDGAARNPVPVKCVGMLKAALPGKMLRS